MIYKELTEQLNKVKKENDITPDLAEELTLYALQSNMISLENKHPNMNQKQVFNMARMQVLNQFDNLLLNFHEEI